MSQPPIFDPNRKPIFWGEIAPCEHVVQIYERSEVFLDALEGFVAGGFRVGDSVIVIATSEHLETLSKRLTQRGIDIAAMRRSGLLIERDAELALYEFMDDEWPNEEKFARFVGELLDQASTGGRRVRAFGEMVAVMWSRGLTGATIRLETIWHNLCQERAFSLFCAYPRSGFDKDAETSIREICEAHHRIIEA